MSSDDRLLAIFLFFMAIVIVVALICGTVLCALGKYPPNLNNVHAPQPAKRSGA